MADDLPCLPGYSFRDLTKTNFGYPRTLVFSKGVAVTQPFESNSAQTASELLSAQNSALDREKITELTYGPKKSPPKPIKLPRYLKFDKKVLRFDGYFREDIDDWSNETYRIRQVKVFYYLQNDTMEVYEPIVPNSGLVQGILFKRHAFPHPKGHGRQYLWKDLNIGIDLIVYGITIHLTDCDQWTREYLINAGIELHRSEAVPPDPYQQEKLNKETRREFKHHSSEDQKLHKFFSCDRKVLRFYGTWKDVLCDPPQIKRIILQYYLVDDTMELLEEQTSDSGKTKVLVKKQKIPVDRNELPDSFPSSYLEVQEDDLTWFKPEDFRTGKDIVVLGKKIFLYDCDEFTREYYRNHFGVEDMESIEVLEKPKPQAPKIFPPHTGIGSWDDSLQNCISLIPKPPRKDVTKGLLFDGITLRYRAELVSPLPDDKNRRFVVSFHPSDDTVTITEEYIPNSGFPGGAFLKRRLLPKPGSGSSSAGRPEHYGPADFCIGQEIRACGKTFVLKDADRFVLTFMEQHPEIYTEDQIQKHRNCSTEAKEQLDTLHKEKADLAKMMREDVLQGFGSSPYPLPSCLEPASDLQYRGKLMEELYCANMPISMELLRLAVDFCTDQNDRTDMNEVRKLLLPVLGHDIRKGHH